VAIVDFDAVLLAAQGGAEWAIAVVYREFTPPLRRFFGARAAGEAEDLAQEVWLAAGSQLRSFTGDEAGFRAWLFTFAHRRLIEHWRTAARRLPAAAEVNDREDVCAADPGDVVASASAVERLIAALPDDQAAVVLLRVVADLDAVEVGRIVRKSPGAVRVLQHRALRRLAALTPDPLVTK
jgi:RNA polymerase sigma-70 factor (ECF subfamily)